MGLWEDLKKGAEETVDRAKKEAGAAGQRMYDGAMDAISDPGRAARDVLNGANDATGGLATMPFDPLGVIVPNAANPRQPPAQQTPEDPRITKQRSGLMDEASKFRQGLDRYKGEKYGIAANAARDQLNETTKTIRASANQRGLLYSGMRQGQEAGARGRMASILAQQRAEINKEAEDLAAAKDATAANVGLAGYDNAIKRADDAYNLASQNEIARRKALAQIGEGVGYGFGAMYKKREGKTE
jgi:hypothetical protein